ncbi:MAG: chemotaxis protein CheW, partial [bacterium]|nr:chemotaxis protein CheW [bacterium]
MAQVLRCRIRYFTDGVVLGSQGFVDAFFERQREAFSERRTCGGRRM